MEAQNSIENLVRKLIDERLKHVYSEVLNIDDLIRLTGYSKSYIYKLKCQGKIPSYSPENIGGKLFFKRAEITEWLTANKNITTQSLINKLK